jgi:Fic family protein
MQVVSGAMGKEKVHFEAPKAGRLKKETTAFLDWFEGEEAIDPVLKSGLAHLWFVSITRLQTATAASRAPSPI